MSLLSLLSSALGPLASAIGWAVIALVAFGLGAWWARALRGIPHDGQPTCIEDIVYDAQGKCVSRRLISPYRLLTMDSGKITHLSK